MNRMKIVIASTILVAAGAVAQTTDSPLVAAAKRGAAARQKVTNVITDETVAKSKGVISTSSGAAEGPEYKAAPPVPPASQAAPSVAVAGGNDLRPAAAGDSRQPTPSHAVGGSAATQSTAVSVTPTAQPARPATMQPPQNTSAPPRDAQNVSGPQESQNAGANRKP